MRTTVGLDESLIAEVKFEAAHTDRMLTAFVKDTLCESLTRQRRSAGTALVGLPGHIGHGIQPWAALEDTIALLDLLSSARGTA